jgi:nucleoside phosphorylase
MIAVANGAGSTRAYAAAMQIPRAAQIWNIGFGGAADPSLGAGDIFVAVEVCANGHTFPCERPRAPAPFHSGIVHSIGNVAQTAREKRDHYESGASVIEMEAAGTARAASELHAPFFCVRAISDLATEDFANDFGAALGADGRFSAVRLVAGAMLSPRSRFSELIRLQKRTTTAARNLGEFLAHCEF